MPDITEKYIGEALLSASVKKKLSLLIKNGAITTDKLADGAVTLAKLGMDVPLGKGTTLYKADCTNAGDMQYKGCEIPNFQLSDGTMLAVTFTQGIAVDNSYLNVNAGKYIPLYYKREPLVGGVVSSNTTLFLVYEQNLDRYNILSGITGELQWL